MPAVGWVFLVFVVLPVVGLVGVKTLATRKSKAKFSSDGAIAETFASDDDGTFVMSVPAHASPVGIYVEYNITGAGSRRRYGLVLRADVERADFQQRGEYLIGSAQQLFREVPQMQSLDASIVHDAGASVSRTLLLARVPAGDSLRVHGKVKRTIGETHSLHVYAKPLVS